MRLAIVLDTPQVVSTEFDIIGTRFGWNLARETCSGMVGSGGN